MRASDTFSFFTLIFILCFLSLILILFTYAEAQEWKNPLRYLGKLNSPLVEITPFVFKDRFYLLENWQKQWEFPCASQIFVRVAIIELTASEIYGSSMQKPPETNWRK